MGEKNERTFIKKNIIMLLKKRFHNVKWDSIDDKVNCNLLGNEFRFVARDMLILYYDIKEAFKININKDAILKGHFDTINNIIDIVYREINKQDEMVL